MKIFVLTDKFFARGIVADKTFCNHINITKDSNYNHISFHENLDKALTYISGKFNGILELIECYRLFECKLNEALIASFFKQAIIVKPEINLPISREIDFKSLLAIK